MKDVTAHSTWSCCDYFSYGNPTSFSVFKNVSILVSVLLDMLYWIDNFDDMLNLGQQLVDHGDVHFIVYDYLSEITMSLLTAARNKQPVRSYF